MMSSDLFFREKIPVAILGAAGKLGEGLIQKLSQHPWFEIAALCDDSRNVIGHSYGQVISESSPLSLKIKNLVLQSCKIPLNYPLVFSCLQSTENPLYEEKLWEASGSCVVVSPLQELENGIPLIFPEVNGDDLAFNRSLNKKIRIIGTPHQLVCGVALALKPLLDRYGLDDVQIYVSQFDELACAESEQQILLLLGCLGGRDLQKEKFTIRMQKGANGEKENVISMAIKLKRQAQQEEIIQCWRQFHSASERLTLPSASYHPLFYSSGSVTSPIDKEIDIYLEELQVESNMDFTFKFSFSPGKQEGVSGMLLNGELLVVSGDVYW